MNLQIGTICTISPDNAVRYRITDIKVKNIKLTVAGVNTAISYYYADLESVDVGGSPPLHNISVELLSSIEN